MSLSERIRPNVEATPWVIAEVKALETELAHLRAQLPTLLSFLYRVHTWQEGKPGLHDIKELVKGALHYRGKVCPHGVLERFVCGICDLSTRAPADPSPGEPVADTWKALIEAAVADWRSGTCSPRNVLIGLEAAINSGDATADSVPEADSVTRKLTDGEFSILLELCMVSDPWPLNSGQDVLENLLTAEANVRSFSDWVEAYHFHGKVAAAPGAK